MLAGRVPLTALLIDSTPVRVNEPCAMDMDDLFSSKPDDPLLQLSRQDLDPLSIDELQARIAALREEIARVEAHIDQASRHRSAAEELFKR
jgi:uncharacterized small protein (DUF1192 family)